MCWGVPAKVLETDGVMAKVDFGGSIKDVLVINRDIKPGDLVIVHAGTIIGKIEGEELDNTLKLYGDLLKDSLIEDGMDPQAAEKNVKEWIRYLRGEEEDG